MVEDVDGNHYRTVRVGEQLWMAENLRTTRLKDGSPLSHVEDYDSWVDLESAAYCWYNNDSLHAADYGALYNYQAIESGKLCPEGWHVPGDEEWTALELAFTADGNPGGALKEAGTAHWKTPNTAASDESGFTALPAGYRSYNGTFNLIRISGFWWTSSPKSFYGSENTVLYRGLNYDSGAIERNVASLNNGFSVRCVKDQAE